MVVIEANIAWKSVRLHLCAYPLRHFEAYRQNIYFVFFFSCGTRKGIYCLASAGRWAVALLPIFITPGYSALDIILWWWSIDFEMKIFKKTNYKLYMFFFFGCCCCDLFVLSTVARLLHGFDSRCIQCVFGWYQRQSMDGTLNALRGPFTSVGRFVALQNNNNNVSLCWVDSKKKNFTSCLYIMMCSFWHRYTFMFIQ